MEQEKKQQIALMRYSAISPLVTGTVEDYNSMADYYAAVSQKGRPKVFNLDNGKSYRNHQMELLAARIGSTISYCHPYSPTQKDHRCPKLVSIAQQFTLQSGLHKPVYSNCQ